MQSSAAAIPAAGSMEEFISEHYWGYASLPGKRSREYRVTHPQWAVRAASEWKFSCNAAELYGKPFAERLGGAPASGFVAEGSQVSVHRGSLLPSA
jgi:hypothetical protein